MRRGSFITASGVASPGTCSAFVQKIENITFPEAVRLVAQKLGIALPKASYSSPAEAKEARLRTQLLEVHERACGFFQECLKRPEGARARNICWAGSWMKRRSRNFALGMRRIPDFCCGDRLKSEFSERAHPSLAIKWVTRHTASTPEDEVDSPQASDPCAAPAASRQVRRTDFGAGERIDQRCEIVVKRCGLASHQAQQVSLACRRGYPESPSSPVVPRVPDSRSRDALRIASSMWRTSLVTPEHRFRYVHASDSGAEFAESAPRGTNHGAPLAPYQSWHAVRVQSAASSSDRSVFGSTTSAQMVFSNPPQLTVRAKPQPGAVPLLLDIIMFATMSPPPCPRGKRDCAANPNRDGLAIPSELAAGGILGLLTAARTAYSEESMRARPPACQGQLPGLESQQDQPVRQTPG